MSYKNQANSYYSLPNVFDELFDVVDYVFTNSPSCGDVVKYATTGGTSSSPLWYTTTPNLRFVDYTLDTVLDQYDKLAYGSGAEKKDYSPIALFDQAKKIYRDGLPTFPAADIYIDNEKNSLNFDLALPGYSLKDIDISFEDDYMIVNIKKDNNIKKTKEDGKETRVYLRQGIKKSSINFKVPVPSTRFNVQDSVASYVGGMLHVEIPRAAEHTPHKIKIIEKEVTALEDKTK